jgi:hypothetical protein
MKRDPADLGAWRRENWVSHITRNTHVDTPKLAAIVGLVLSMVLLTAVVMTRM